MPQNPAWSFDTRKPAPELLIVEDDPESGDLLGDFCRSQGFDVTVAHDGRAAVTAIQRAPARYAIVITDLHLPGADGFEVLRAAREANASSYVVIITGYATIDSAVRAVKEGAYDYLAKPFGLGQLEIVLRRIRDRMDLERENRELLARRPAASTASASHPDVAWRLQAIEDRLAHIESLLLQRLKP